MKKNQHKIGKRVLSIMTVCALLTGSLGGLTVGAVDVSMEQLAMPASNDTALRLWYTKPSSAMLSSSVADKDKEKELWQQFTLPIGNGDMGANVYGEIATERLSLNEKTLWTGGPAASRPGYNGGNVEANGNNGATQKEIARLFLAGEDAAAASLCGKLTGVADEYVKDASGKLLNTTVHGYGAYQPWGELKIQYTDITDTSGATGYTRDLDLDDSLAGVRFTLGGTTYTREYLMSHPDNVLAAKLTATGANKLNLKLTLPSSQGGTTVAEGNDTLKLAGAVTDNQLKYSSFLKAVPKDGTVTGSGDALTVTGASEVYLYFSAATDYKNDYPVYRTGESAEALDTRVKRDVDAAAAKGYDRVKTDHMADYQSLYGRMRLDLGQADSSKTTDELLKTYNAGTATETERRLLEVMLFQYGRYLTIGSSREDSQLPSNLQGVWNNQLDPAWHSDYHMNVNLQMNYWPTYVTNLSECANPLVSYIDSLREPGRETARVYAGVTSAKDASGNYTEANGFMAHTQNNPFGWTCPGWSFDWGWSPAAVPWMLQNCWDYYDFTRDTDYLQNNIYPMMKEEAKLYDQMLVKDAEGKLVSAPAYSPEHGPKTLGNTYEQTLVWQLYEDTITAANLLGVDSDLVTMWTKNQADLKGPVEIGTDGQVKEWFHETTLDSVMTYKEQYEHRHLSHMLGLFPGDYISVETPELLEAARVSMQNRIDQSTGWGMGQRINTWARLGDGDHALKLIGDLFAGGIYTNLWDSHAPFQIDGNFGMTSGVAEMLIQSNMGYINLFPAMPYDWMDGSFEGMLARGNFEVSAAWSNGGADKVTILSNLGGDAIVQYPGLSLATVADESGNFVATTSVSKDRISFPTTAGKTYTILNIPKQNTSVVENLVAYRLTGNEVELSWTKQADSSYRVYRQIDGGEKLAVSDVLDGNSFKDTTALESLGSEFTYTVAQVVDSQEYAPVPAVTVKDLRNMGTLDDRDPRIAYGGSWSKWGGTTDNNYLNTVTFLEAAGASSGVATGTETVSLLFLGTGIEVVAVKGTNHGNVTFTVDNGEPVVVNCYNNPRLAQQTVFSKTDLPFGIHTIKVNVQAGKKVEMDAFRVLNSTVAQPTGITVSSVSGVTLLNKAGSTLQMQAAILPANAADKAVTWSVTKPDGTATTAATIDQNGLLTVGTAADTVRVTATSVQVPSISGHIDITIATPQFTETIVQDNNGDAQNTTPNPAITWSGTWYVWEEGSAADGCEGGTKCETTTPGSAFTYNFTGNAIEVYVQKNGDTSSYNITLDGVAQGNYVLNGSKAGRVKLARFENLDATQPHILVCTEAGYSGKNKVNLDYLKVFSPVGGTNSADKSALLTAIQTYQGKLESDYTSATWTPFKTAFDAAVALMNKADATQSEIDAAVLTLNTTGAALSAATPSAPDTTGATIQTSSVGGTSATLSWSAVAGAAKYNIYSDSGRTDLAASTTKTAYVLSGLTSGNAYTYYLEAENAGGKTAFPTSVTFTTKDTVPPTAVTGLAYEGGIIKWTAATDNVGVTGYKVYVDGVLKATVTDGVQHEIAIDLNSSHVIKVVAVDAAGNLSAAATITVGSLVVTHTVTLPGGTGYVAAGAATVIDGEDYTFTVTLQPGYTQAAPTVKTTGDVTLTPTVNGSVYTCTIADVTANQVITVSGVAADTYTVTFDVTGGTLGDSAEGTMEVTFQTLYGALPTATPTDDAKVFDGWFTQAEGGTKVTAATTVTATEDHTLYARWIDKGTSATPDATVSGMNAMVTLPYAADITLTVKEGYTSYQWQRDTGDGWENLADETARTYTIPNDDVVFANNGWKYRCSITNEEPGKLPAETDGGEGVTLNIQKGTQNALTGLDGQMPTTEETTDGRITGLDASKSYQYKLKGSVGEYAALTADTDLAPGTYLVHLVGTDVYNASPDAEVIVPAYSEGPISVISVALNPATLSLYSNRAPSSSPLSVTINPGSATNKNVTWSSDNNAVATVVNGLVEAKGNGTAIITVTTEDGGKTATCAVTVSTYTEPVNPPSGNGGGSSSGGTTVKNEDGSTTTTVVDKKTGAVTETTVMPNGDKSVAVKNPDGSSVTTGQAKNGATSKTTVNTDGKTTATVTLPDALVTAANKKGETVTLPLPKLPASSSAEESATVAVSVPAGSRIKVEIPVELLAPGTVAILVNADGSETLVKTSHMTDSGLALTLHGDAMVKLVDNSKSFADVPETDWYADAVGFVSSRELFQGVSGDSFAPADTMTRGMLVTVLARLDGQRTEGGKTWYAPAIDWAKGNGISDGESPESNITREQLAIMLYRYAGMLKLDTAADISATESFVDRESVNTWADEAMSWAVAKGILTGKTGQRLDPSGSATRAEVAAMLERFVRLV